MLHLIALYSNVNKNVEMNTFGVNNLVNWFWTTLNGIYQIILVTLCDFDVSTRQLFWITLKWYIPIFKGLLNIKFI